MPVLSESIKDDFVLHEVKWNLALDTVYQSRDFGTFRIGAISPTQIMNVEEGQNHE